MIFESKPAEQPSLRAAITQRYRMDEARCVDELLQTLNLSDAQRQHIEQVSTQLVQSVRKKRLAMGGLDAFLYHYELSSEEGIALMCLAEAMLRIPDKDTIDHLIKDKVTAADWRANVGRSDSILTNAATWGLMLTGKVLTPANQSHDQLKSTLKGLIERTGEPVIRKALGEAVKILGRQFILGRTIEEALTRGNKRRKMGYRFSYDMLGEAARTAEDAERYQNAYIEAIHAIGQFSNGLGPVEGPGISVKLSALYPRYEFAHRQAAIDVLTERLLELARLAKDYNIGMTVDAEEASRLEMSLDIIEAVFTHPDLAEWDGFGLAVQAYQKRAYAVIDWLIDLARRANKRMMVRLVKGAYWDSEIKESQVQGLDGYPVFTRKVATDVSYLACAQKLAQAMDVIFPQFATHNAHTVATVLEFVQGNTQFEFQCLQGMGKVLYDDVVTSKNGLGYPCRVYAPVGSHQDLLPYLVRRLLENGANSSFVNRIVDENLPIEELIADPIEQLKAMDSKPHPKIPLPRDIYGETRQNSRGLDVANVDELTTLMNDLQPYQANIWHAQPTLMSDASEREQTEILEPADHRNVVCQVTQGTQADVDFALEQASHAVYRWNHTPVVERAQCLIRLADLFEQHRPELMALLIREAGKSIPDAIAEVREAVDFCRYYAEQAMHSLVVQTLPGPTGELNQLQMHGRGIIACISPWNFPLAIFTGQVVAALVTGNAVIAKPAGQTAGIGAKAVALMHEAGIPKAIVQLMPGRGSVVGNALVEDLRVQGIVFTGSTETAQGINLKLAQRKGPIVPFIAETGGQNAMIVDSSALPEQLVMDVIASAFYSAGQRCSALRVLFVQDTIADKVITMLKGAMAELTLSNPSRLSTDVGPVIDDAARQTLVAHFEKMCQEGKLLYQVEACSRCDEGTFFAPCAFEIDRLSMLEREVFGPILHVIRYRRSELDQVIEDINATGYGLTLGIHTRIDATAEYIQQRVHAGNTYVNRNMIGAVVGVQPFGGEGLSGTGPKAGGPHYLPRLCTERTVSTNTAATGGNTTLLSL